jgi:hypothetical protein
MTEPGTETLQVRSVKAGRGWVWIKHGVRFFLSSPAMWIAMLLILFVAMKVVNVIPPLALLAILLMPVFLAGLMEGCRALEEGRGLALTHLAAGFQKHAARLVTIGGISLIGNLAIAMTIYAIGGEAIATLAKTLSKNPAMTPEMAKEVQALAASATNAVLIGSLASVPLLMALWFAPLLVYFHDMRPLQALQWSFVACLTNVLPFFVYGFVVLAALMLLVPAGVRLGVYDLGLWLMAPVLVPSIYASYRDIFSAGGPAGSGDTAPDKRD